MDQRFFMFNALWFKPDGGREKYMEYLRAADPVVAQFGGKPQPPAYAPQVALIGEFDADLVFFVEWPSEQVFMSFANSDEYKAVAHLREEAITKSLLVRCAAVTPPLA